LIGHLLADGQSVLVTSHTTKALRVLREHVIENLRPLCVSVLESDLESREQLKESVLKIASRLSQSSEQELVHQGSFLDRRRNDRWDALERSREDLRRARADEYRDIVFGGTSVTPSEAARKVTAGRGQHDWIPGPVALGEPLPLSAKEIEELYATNASTFPEDERLAKWSLPPAEIILSPDEFSRALEAKQAEIDNRLWESIPSLLGKEQDIRELAQEFRDAIAEFKRFEGWQLAAVDAGRDHAGMRRPWDELLQKTKEVREMVAEARADFIKHCPEVVDDPALDLQLTMAGEIREHLRAGGEIRERRFFFVRAIRKRWQSAYEAWQVNGRRPESADELHAIHRFLAIKLKRTELGKLWDALIAANQGRWFRDLLADPERTAEQFAPAIAECLNWWSDRWLCLIERLRALGFNWSRFLAPQPASIGKHGEMIRCVNAVESGLLADLEKAAKRVGLMGAERRLEHALKSLAPFDRPEVVELRRAMQVRDPAGYRTARKNCLEAAQRQTIVLRRYELLGRLERQTLSGRGVAERWASAIRGRFSEHGKPQPPGDVTLAWEWRQLNQELERRGEVDVGELGSWIAALQDELRRTTNELIDHRAWAGQVRRTSLKQRKALMGWLDTVNRIGKGTGKRAPQLRREAQRLMEECRDAVPVWVMPLARLVESFDFGKQCFDVVIIDESSQCDVMALLALALAKKVVIVGDDEQVSPLAVGQNQEYVDHLIKEHLAGIANAHLYDGRLSIYDLAKQSFEGLIRLLEHFRCVPDIIQFSNYLCYQGEIKPLREESNSPLRPHVVSFRVEGVCDSDGNVNVEEAWTVASLLAAAIERPEYRDMTFGVISLLGDSQAYEIEQLLLRHLPPEEYQRRRIVCGNSAQFQGDERDVMFLSMVWSAQEKPLNFNDRKEFRQRFNVAASRARNQMWLVYSLDPANDLKTGDLRRRLIEHAVDPRAVMRELKPSLERTQSRFEELVLGHLVRAGYRVRPQSQVGRYRIDFVIEGSGKRLALECDGDRFHPLEKLPEDMERQAILERLGWRFIRIRGSAFFRNPEKTMQGVFKKLEEAGVVPEGAEPPRTADEDSVISVIRQRASELRASWQEELNAENQNVGEVVQEGGERKARRKFGDKEAGAKRTSEGLADVQPTTPATPFAVEGELPTSSEQGAPPELPRTVTVPRDVSARESESGDDSDFGGRGISETASIDRLLAALDKTIFPAVAGTDPRGTRLARLKRWRSALAACDNTPEAVMAALAECDAAIRNGKDGPKVVAAVQSWDDGRHRSTDVRTQAHETT
jgi:very-short-patch-repair endonuclease